MSLDADHPVLILGAGINGAALARELVLNHVPVTVVDTSDIAFGASAYSSRLVHGGLRYLEYGEFDLVRESLEERNRLLTLAPQFVHPLRLYIPVSNLLGGWYTQLARFLGLPGGKTASRSRGLFVVRAGLWMYDRYAKGDLLPPQSVHRVGEKDVPRVTTPNARWLAAYSDAQIPYVERFVVGLLRDADQIAKRNRVSLQVYTYHEAVRFGNEVGIRPKNSPTRDFAATFTPSAIVNATGAWVDHTLQRLKVPSDQLMGGTKGSHFVTFRRDLREALDGGGIYAEARDGRPIFILPFCEGTLVGTTDIPFSGDPATAVAGEEELAYLLAAVEHVFPQVRLSRCDIALHYSGVRPLPFVGKGIPAGITRRHLWRWHDDSQIPMVSLIGGKITTCRAFAEQTVAELLPKLGAKVETNSSRHRFEAPADLRTLFPPHPCVTQTTIPVEAVRYAIRVEWAKTLGDLVERRLMLIFEPRIYEESLRELTTILAEEGRIPTAKIDSEVESYRERLETHFGRRLATAAPTA